VPVTFAHLNRFVDTPLDCKNVERVFFYPMQLTKHPKIWGGIK